MGGSTPYVGMIIVVPYNFAPAGWMFCQGQLLPISEYETLFNLIGTTYGGDGQSTFALPDLRSRVAVHTGSGLTFGSNGGVEQVALTANQMPAHTHPAQVSSGNQNSAIPNGAVLAKGPQTYTNDHSQNNSLAANCLSSSGGSQPHTNIKPYLGLNFIISLFGIYPSQN
jgi:microcystin-dependent protein